MDDNTRERMTALVIEYRSNLSAYIALVGKIDEMRKQLTGTEKEAEAISAELKGIRAKEAALFEELKASGADIDALKPEIDELVKNI